MKKEKKKLFIFDHTHVFCKIKILLEFAASTDVSSDSSKSSSKWKSSQSSTPTSTSRTMVGMGNFSFEELYKATGKFSPDNKIGEGAFGIVYKGKLYDGSLVAVKCARKV